MQAMQQARTSQAHEEGGLQLVVLQEGVLEQVHGLERQRESFLRQSF
jgi:hypothetical protein